MEEFLNKSIEDFKKSELIASNSLPPTLQQFLNISSTDSKFREQYGTDANTWKSISSCILYALESEANGFWRYLNGLLLISRNLVTTKGAGNLAWSEGSGFQSLLLIEKLLRGKPDLEPIQERTLSTAFQFVANMSSESVTGSPIPALHVPIDQFDELEIHNFCRELENANNIKPILIFIETTVAQDPHNMVELILTKTNGQKLFLEILQNTELWYSQEEHENHESNNEHCILLVHRIIKHILKAGFGPRYLLTFSETNQQSLILSMLKLFDAGVSSLFDDNDGDDELSLQDHINLILAYNKQLEMIAEQSIQFIKNFPDHATRTESEVYAVKLNWNTLLIILDTLHALLDDKNISVKHELIENTDVIKTLIELLIAAQKSLPRRGKLSEVTTANDGNGAAEGSNPEEFPLIKGKLITLLSVLTMHEAKIQDEIRELHGLEIILSNCMIDRNNPFIRERSILCIKYLLEGNEKNQSLVAQLEAKQSVSEDVIDQVGYETEMVDGKIRLKKKQ